MLVILMPQWILIFHNSFKEHIILWFQIKYTVTNKQTNKKFQTQNKLATGVANEAQAQAAENYQKQ